MNNISFLSCISFPNAFPEKAMCSTPETKEVVENLKRKYPGSQNYNNFSIPVNKTISEDDQELVLKRNNKKGGTTKIWCI